VSLGPSAATPPEEQNHTQNRSKNKAEKPATTDRLHVFAPHVSKIVRFRGKLLKKYVTLCAGFRQETLQTTFD
jgi:hypothetical protein